jgi:hypothetical protein
VTTRSFYLITSDVCAKTYSVYRSIIFCQYYNDMHEVSIVTCCTFLYEVLIYNFKEQFSVISDNSLFHFRKIQLETCILEMAAILKF